MDSAGKDKLGNFKSEHKKSVIDSEEIKDLSNIDDLRACIKKALDDEKLLEQMLALLKIGVEGRKGSLYISELGATYDFLAQLLDNVKVGIIIFTKDGKPLFSNSTARQILNIGSDYIGKRMIPPHLEKFFHKEFMEKLFKPAVETDSPVRGVLKCKINGKTLYLDGVVSPLTILGQEKCFMVRFIDVTDLYELRSKYERASQEWELVFDSLSSMIVFVDNEYKILKLNAAAHELAGKKFKDGMKCYELFHNLSEPPSYCPMKEAIESGEQKEVKAYEPYLDKYFWFRAAPVFDSNGKLIGAIDIIDDITEEEKLRKEIQEGRARYYSILQNSPFGIITMTTAGDPLYMNDAARRILRVPEGAVVDKNVYDQRVSPRARKMHKMFIETFLEPALKTKDVVHGELLERTDKGDVLVIRGAIAPIIEDGEIKELIFMFGDDTERWKLHRSVIEHRNKLQAVFDNVAAGIMMTDANLKVQYMNANAYKILGLPPDYDYSDKVPSEIFGTEDFKEHIQRKAMETMSTVRGVIFLKRGTVQRALEVASAPIFGRDETTLHGWAIMFSDITERWELEQMKTQFVSLVSHELRTPLTSIKGSLGLILAGAAGEISPQARQFLEIALNSTDRLIRIVNDLLDLSKLEAGKVQLNLVEVSPREVVEECITELESFAESRKITILNEVPENLPTVLADRDRLKQTIINLLSNAIKFSPEGKKVIVGAEMFDSKAVKFWVKDFGIGIPEDELDRIFEKFAQVKKKAVSPTEGTGLGLSITKQIVELHGGRIWVESEVGKGTTFYFTIPLKRVSRVEVTEAAHGSGKTVLVVEDSENTAKVLRNAISASGHNVIWVSTLKQAREVLRKNKPDVITLDIVLPDGNGLELLKEVRSNPETRSIPVIIVSVKDEVQLGFELGADAYFIKPVDMQKVVQTVNNFIKRSKMKRILIVSNGPIPEKLSHLLDIPHILVRLDRGENPHEKTGDKEISYVILIDIKGDEKFPLKDLALKFYAPLAILRLKPDEPVFIVYPRWNNLDDFVKELSKQIIKSSG